MSDATDDLDYQLSGDRANSERISRESYKPTGLDKLEEKLDKIFTKLELVSVNKNGTNDYRESKPFISQLTEASKLINGLLREARLLGGIEELKRLKLLFELDYSTFKNQTVYRSDQLEAQLTTNPEVNSNE